MSRASRSWLPFVALGLATLSFIACARTGDPAIDDINTATVTTTEPASTPETTPTDSAPAP